jgi:HK97 family phage portal protein
MFEKLKSLFAPEQKQFAHAPLMAMYHVGQPYWAPRNYLHFAREGFSGNAVAYRCVRMISEAAASVPLLLYKGNEELNAHAFLDLLRQPNPAQTGQALVENIVAYLLVAGNSYIEISSIDGTPRELVSLRPDRMQVIPGSKGWVEAYQYSVYGSSIKIPAEQVLHLKLFNPLDDYYGLSPLEAAARSLDTHNSASAWNKAMLDNAARPSGALVFSGGDGQLSNEQFDRLKSELQENFTGAAQAGRPMVLEGGLDWKEMGFSPKDMDFINAKNNAAREIALAFGVPPMLLGIPGDNTFSNYAEANRVFWRHSVMPMLRRVIDCLNMNVGAQFETGLRLDLDLDQVEALSHDRDALWARVNGASFLTDAEKRQAVGYGK